MYVDSGKQEVSPNNVPAPFINTSLFPPVANDETLGGTLPISGNVSISQSIDVPEEVARLVPTFASSPIIPLPSASRSAPVPTSTPVHDSFKSSQEASSKTYSGTGYTYVDEGSSVSQKSRAFIILAIILSLTVVSGLVFGITMSKSENKSAPTAAAPAQTREEAFELVNYIRSLKAAALRCCIDHNMALPAAGRYALNSAYVKNLSKYKDEPIDPKYGDIYITNDVKGRVLIGLGADAIGPGVLDGLGDMARDMGLYNVNYRQFTKGDALILMLLTEKRAGSSGRNSNNTAATGQDAQYDARQWPYNSSLYKSFLEENGGELDYATVNSDQVNCRESPDLQARVICQLDEGDMFPMVGRFDSGMPYAWIEISLPGLNSPSGWVYGEYLDVQH